MDAMATHSHKLIVVDEYEKTREKNIIYKHTLCREILKNKNKATATVQ